MTYIKLTFLLGLSLIQIGCSSTNQQTSSDTSYQVVYVDPIASREPLKQLYNTYTPSDREIQARSLLGSYLNKLDNYGFTHLGAAPQIGKVTDTHPIRFSFAYYSDAHDGIVLVHLGGSEMLSRITNNEAGISSIDGYDLEIKFKTFCSKTLNMKDLHDEWEGWVENSTGLTSESKDYLNDQILINRRWLLNPRAFRLGSSSTLSNTIETLIEARPHIDDAVKYNKWWEDYTAGKVNFRSNAPTFASVKACVVDVSRLTFFDALID